MLLSPGLGGRAKGKPSLRPRLRMHPAGSFVHPAGSFVLTPRQAGESPCGVVRGGFCTGSANLGLRTRRPLDGLLAGVQASTPGDGVLAVPTPPRPVPPQVRGSGQSWPAPRRALGSSPPARPSPGFRDGSRGSRLSQGPEVRSWDVAGSLGERHVCPARTFRRPPCCCEGQPPRERTRGLQQARPLRSEVRVQPALSLA